MPIVQVPNVRHLAKPVVWGLLVLDGQTGTNLPTDLEYLQKFGKDGTLTDVYLSALITSNDLDKTLNLLSLKIRLKEFHFILRRLDLECSSSREVFQSLCRHLRTNGAQ